MTPQSLSHDDEEDQRFSEAHTALRRWRAAHPHATFTAIEEAVDAELQRVRARLVAEAAGEGAARGRIACLPPARRVGSGCRRGADARAG